MVMQVPGVETIFCTQAVIPSKKTSQAQLDRICELAALLATELNSLRVSQTMTAALAITETADLPSRIDFFQEVARFEKLLVECMLERAGGNQAKAADRMGLRPSTLNAIIKRLGIKI